MGRFAYLVHPRGLPEVTSRYRFLRRFPDRLAEGLTRFLPTVKAASIGRITSNSGTASGWVLAFMLTDRQMLSLPEPLVLKKIISAGKMAQRLGADIVGLGGLASMVGDHGLRVAEALDMGVTTGRSYAVATSIEATRMAAAGMGINLRKAEVVVLGAGGAIGKACSRLLASQVRYLTLIGTDRIRMEVFASRLMRESGVAPGVCTEPGRALARAEVVVNASEDIHNIDPGVLKPGAVVCDVIPIPSLTRAITSSRDDILAIEGAIVQLPEPVELNLVPGLPAGYCFAPVAEAILLALEGRSGDFSLGPKTSFDRIVEINELAQKHGLRVAGFRRSDRAVTPREIDRIRARSCKGRLPQISRGLAAERILETDPGNI